MSIVDSLETKARDVKKSSYLSASHLQSVPTVCLDQGCGGAAPAQHFHDAQSPCLRCEVRLTAVCAALTLPELSALEKLSHPQHIPHRCQIFTQDEPMRYVYTITSGMVRLYRLLPDGRRPILGFALPGDFLGLTLPELSHCAADAVGAVTLCRFERHAFARMVEMSPKMMQRLHEFAIHELSLAQDQMVLLGRRTAEERVAAFLLGLRARYAAITDWTVYVPLPMGRQDIADFLGLTIETVSRILTRFAREKLIVVVPDGVRLLDLVRLEEKCPH